MSEIETILREKGVYITTTEGDSMYPMLTTGTKVMVQKPVFPLKKFDVVHPDAAFKDWYEFVEYGATDPLIIWLQKNGFTREAATYLKANRTKYLIEIDEQTYLYEALLQCDNESIRREAQQVYYNNHELFMPNFLM